MTLDAARLTDLARQACADHVDEEARRYGVLLGLGRTPRDPQPWPAVRAILGTWSNVDRGDRPDWSLDTDEDAELVYLSVSRPAARGVVLLYVDADELLPGDPDDPTLGVIVTPVTVAEAILRLERIAEAVRPVAALLPTELPA
jgi:hypothetical protein